MEDPTRLYCSCPRRRNPAGRHPRDGARRHVLLPKSVAKTIPPLYSQENESDPIAQVKFFSPYSPATWYITEFDGDDQMFGWVTLFGGEGELGYSSLSELQDLNRAGLPLIERDLYWSPRKLSEAKQDHQQRRNPYESPPHLREQRMRDKEEAAETEKRSEHDIKLEIISNSLANLAKNWEYYLNDRLSNWPQKKIDDIAFYGPFAGSSYLHGLRNDRWYGNVFHTGRGSIPTGERLNIPFDQRVFESYGKPVPVAAPTNLAVITHALLEHYPEYLYEDWYNKRINKIAQKMRNDLRKLVEAYGLDETVGDVHERLPTWPVTNEELEREVIGSSGEASLMHHDWQSLVDDDTWRRNPNYLQGKDYPRLCGGCQLLIDQVLGFISELPDEYASDEEGAIDYLYDNSALCGGRECDGV